MINQNLLLTGDDGYNLTKSIRFRSSASAYLNRTPASATNRTTWTYSYWFKGINTTGSVDYWALTAFSDGNNYTAIRHRYPSDIDVLSFNGGSAVSNVKTAALFRDPAAWYHMVIVFDTSNATQADRIQIYQNGVRCPVQSSPTYPSAGSPTGWVNSTAIHYIGRQSTEYFEGYMAEINLIDGQALTPSSFGETSTTTGVWIPKKYTGTYGTNGFYLPFTDTTSTSTLGTDFSGNSNTWTVNNISLTSGSTYDSMNDVPTLTDITTANYCVMNPLNQNSTGVTIASGNLNVNRASSSNGQVWSTMGMTSGKWYAEVTIGDRFEFVPGIANGNMVGANRYLGQDSNTWGFYNDGQKINSGSYTAYGNSYTDGNVIGVAFDADIGSLYFYINGTIQNSGTAAFTGLTSGPYFFACSSESSTTASSWNFGQQPWAGTLPTNFKALNTFNLPTPTIGATASTTANEYFDATTYTGTGSTQNITNSGSMQPDWVWIKNRSSTNSHQLTDSVRGVNLALASDLTIAEFTGNINAFNTNGFQLTGATNAVNASGQTYVAWQWRASNATAVTNTAGSITSTVSANTTAGFSVVTYTGTGANATVGHGLGVAPSMVIVKTRSLSGENWNCWHTSLGGNTYRILLNTTAATDTGSPTVWSSGGINPTSTTFTVGTANAANGSAATYVAYCFAPIAGYSAFGSYTGNGSTDGTFVYLGFRPRFVLVKRTDSISTWGLIDTARDTYNVTTKLLFPNTSDAENTSYTPEDILSNGFKLRDTTYNISSGTYIYMAFAESPFKYANAR